MAESIGTELISVIDLIRRTVEDDGDKDLDAEWSLFTRFGQSVFQFCTKTWKESEVKKLLSDIKEKLSSGSCSSIVATILSNEVLCNTILMLVNESKTSKEENGKCLEKAKSIREEGTEQFKKKQYEKALITYSKVRFPLMSI